MERQVFSDLVSSIYDCALDSALWPDTLGQLCRAFGFRKGTIDLNRLPDMTSLFNAHYGIDELQAATMVSHYRFMPEVWGGLAATLTRPIDRPWVVSHIMTQEALAGTAYYQRWVEPMGLVDGAAMVLARDSSLFGSIRLATDAKLGMIGDDLVDALQLLLPHCQRAARVNGLLDAARASADNFQAVIDGMTVPIVLVSATCAIVHANPRAAALLDEGLLLATKHGRLMSPLSGVQQTLAETIRQLAHDECALGGNGVGFSIHAPPQRPRALHILPLARGAIRTQVAGDAAAAIFISEAVTDSSFGDNVLQSTFGLTDAELGVFRQLSAGNTTNTIAGKLQIAVSTVRTHVLHLFQKTATHNRAELVRLAQAYANPIKADDRLNPLK